VAARVRIPLGLLSFLLLVRVPCALRARRIMKRGDRGAFGEGVGERPVSVMGDVLVADRGGRGRVAGAVHQLGCGRPVAAAQVNSQRHKQYWPGHNETYGGVTMNIDNDCSNGPVEDNITVVGGTTCL
jgi:hypothetical protein